MAPVSTLPRQPLRSTGLEVSMIGFGSWAADGAGYVFGVGRQDDNDPMTAITTALELGVNSIDSAAVYGLGHSETVVGAAAHAMPAADRPLPVTKCGLVPASHTAHDMCRLPRRHRVSGPDLVGTPTGAASHPRPCSASVSTSSHCPESSARSTACSRVRSHGRRPSHSPRLEAPSSVREPVVTGILGHITLECVHLDRLGRATVMFNVRQPIEPCEVTLPRRCLMTT